MSGNRYIPQKRLMEVGEEGQRRLAEARVLVVGCGALGSPVAIYLAGAGVGKILAADFDTVDISNLHRQVFYSEEHAGHYKAELLAKRIHELNSEVKCEALRELITPSILIKRAEDFDFIVDAADNPQTTYMIDDFCMANNIPYCTAGVRGWEAQIFAWRPGYPSFREIVPTTDGDSAILPCSVTGIIGPTAALAASLQCAEVMKLILGVESHPQLTVANLLSGTFNVLAL